MIQQNMDFLSAFFKLWYGDLDIIMVIATQNPQKIVELINI